MKPDAGIAGVKRSGRSQIKSIIAVLPLLLLLAGCINDGAAFNVDGKQHTISIVRDQKWLWDKKLDLYVVAARLPECQRRHKLKPATIAALTVEVFAVDATNFYLRQSGRVYRIETGTCEGFQALEKEPDGGLGTLLGSFRSVDDAFRFVEAPAPKPAR